MPEIFRGDFLPKWDHLYQNVRSYLKATTIVDSLFSQFVVVFPRFPIVCLCLYIHFFHLACSFVLPCLFSPECDHPCPRYFGVIFHPSGTICPKRKILPRSNYYCAWRGYFANLLFSPVVSFVCFCLYIFFLFELFFFACFSVFTQVGPSVSKIF